MSKERILIVDDERDIRTLLCISLERMGYESIPAANCAEAIKLIDREHFDLALTDVRLPDGSGMDLIRRFRKSCPDSPIAVMTAYDTTDIAVDAMKRGAFDFLPKPIRHERLKALVDDALERTSGGETGQAEDCLIGATEPIKQLRKLIGKVSQTQAPVLITGESGTGKELVARAIHRQSHRREKPFVAVNCGAIPSELLESEFFGHLKGSFTGATADKDGLFQAAEGGTLFLDEVADLPLNMQVKLLRAIQEKAIRPVGAQREIMVNVRILSATHQDLVQAVEQGNFRQDLFYRLNVIPVHTPSLRERVADIPALSRFILDALGGSDISIDEQVYSLLDGYSFPGNVRELENILHRAFALCDDNRIEATDIQIPTNGAEEPGQPTATSVLKPLEIDDLDAYLADVEKTIIEAVLEDLNWNRAEAAQRLNLSARQFRYKLSKYGLTSD